MILLEHSWTGLRSTVGVQDESDVGCISSKLPVKLLWMRDRDFDLFATAIVDYLAKSPCLQTGAAGAKR